MSLRKKFFSNPFVLTIIAIVLGFCVASLILLAAGYPPIESIRTLVESMIGRQAIVVSEIDNLQGIGRVTVGGQEWTARTEQEGLILKEGTVVVVKEVKGVKLIVEERKEEN